VSHLFGFVGIESFCSGCCSGAGCGFAVCSGFWVCPPHPARLSTTAARSAAAFLIFISPYGRGPERNAPPLKTTVLLVQTLTPAVVIFDRKPVRDHAGAV
jgi:hypothetical protein